MEFKGWRLVCPRTSAFTLGFATLFFLALPFSLRAVTEVTFTRMGSDKVEVETDTGEKRIYQDSIPTTANWPTRPTSVATISPLQKTRPPTAGKILSTPLLPVEEQTEFQPLYNDPSHGNDVLQPQLGDSAAIAVPTMETEQLQAELAKTRAELARVSRLLHSPVIVSLHGDSAQLQWADARQQIAIPKDGIIKIQLAPK